MIQVTTAVNENIPEIRFNNHIFGKRKIIADIYLDDKALRVEGLKGLENPSNFRRG